MKKYKVDFISYPYLAEKGIIVNHELLTDRLCSQLGYCYCKAKLEGLDNAEDILFLQEPIYHVNGSVRNKLAIFEDDVNELYKKFLHYKEYAKPIVNGFVLPQGCETAALLHIARCQAKEVVRNMYVMKESGIEVAEILFNYVNLVSNYCFVLAIYANSKKGIEEIPFISKSYK